MVNFMKNQLESASGQPCPSDVEIHYEGGVHEGWVYEAQGKIEAQGIEGCSPTELAEMAHHISEVLDVEDKKYNITNNYIQWSSSDGNTYFPASSTKQTLIPGLYEINNCQKGIFFEKLVVRTDGLINFPETNTESIITEVKKFWDREDIFKKYKLPYKRGILLYGPAGGGKTSVIQMINRDLIDRGGVIIKFTHPDLFVEGLRAFRQIQPDTPLVVLMEDIDSIIYNYNESSVLNILDGVENLHKMLFLATTNYPEKLGDRIINRPSRFDKRFKIDFPNIESRLLYLNYLFKDEENKPDLQQWAEDTENFTVSHLKELFVAVVILGDSYEDALDCLKTMREVKEDSIQDIPTKKVGLGFVSNEKSSTRKYRR